MWLLFWMFSVQGAGLPLELAAPQPVPAPALARGIEVHQERIYLFGAAGEPVEPPAQTPPGAVREFRLEGERLIYTGKEMRLAVEGKPLLSHPTGLTHDPKYGTWMGNTVDGKGTLYRLNWSRLYHRENLEDAVLHTVVDDAAVNGSRPEFVRHAGKVFLATADAGPSRNEVRLYDPAPLSRASRTREPGVVAHRFPVGPWVQSLFFWEDRNALVLVQDPGEGGWKLTVLDLPASVQQHKAVVLETVEFPYREPLQGMHLFADRLIGLSATGAIRIGRLSAGQP